MIRRALNKDVSLIRNIGKQYKNNFEKTYDIENYINNENYVILVNEDDFVNAFLIVYKNIDLFELELIVVDRDFQKRGIASNLINYLINNYINNESIILEVAVNNKVAIKLYEKFDFKLINIRKKYYDQKIDAYVMKR